MNTSGNFGNVSHLTTILQRDVRYCSPFLAFLVNHRVGIACRPERRIQTEALVVNVCFDSARRTTMHPVGRTSRSLLFTRFYVLLSLHPFKALFLFLRLLLPAQYLSPQRTFASSLSLTSLSLSSSLKSEQSEH